MQLTIPIHRKVFMSPLAAISPPYIQSNAHPPHVPSLLSTHQPLPIQMRHSPTAPSITVFFRYPELLPAQNPLPPPREITRQNRNLSSVLPILRVPLVGNSFLPFFPGECWRIFGSIPNRSDALARQKQCQCSPSGYSFAMACWFITQSVPEMIRWLAMEVKRERKERKGQSKERDENTRNRRHTSKTATLFPRISHSDSSAKSLNCLPNRSPSTRYRTNQSTNSHQILIFIHNCQILSVHNHLLLDQSLSQSLLLSI
jgi:hypothetical protein